MSIRTSIENAVRNCSGLGKWRQQILLWLPRPLQSEVVIINLIGSLADHTLSEASAPSPFL